VEHRCVEKVLCSVVSFVFAFIVIEEIAANKT
jgi:hypothetical protein